MPSIISGPPGQIIALTDPGVQGVLPIINVTPALNFQSQKSLITRVILSQESNYQFLHTLGGDIYVYIFGDRIGEMTISGICAAVNCDQPGDTQLGFEKVMQWYKVNKISANKAPVTVLIGQTAVTGFVTKLSGGVVDPQLWLMQFDLTMAVVPD